MDDSTVMDQLIETGTLSSPYEGDLILSSSSLSS